ncbi:MAG: ribosome small subunit-dependent GTPase A [Oscillospiraceae bacterium]|nr:ribosome small subunit-dependent GTPase A [Oscillospiraceae bacterium]
MNGTIIKALSGFYYVSAENSVYECRARGKFRLDGMSPLVGDRVSFALSGNGKGYIEKVHDRKNFFIRPAVANIDALVFIAANTNPVTDPFLIDRVSVIAEEAGCELIVCINKTDIDMANELYDIYTSSGFETYRVSAANGSGIERLRDALRGKICAFTGNSGVGKSSILNAIVPELRLEVGEVSEKLGRGRHTTRHVELFSVGEDTFIADTPGFASFEIEMMQTIDKHELQYDFREFGSCIGRCRFSDCAHLKEPGCAVIEAVNSGAIPLSRYQSYKRLYDLSAQNKFWENK